MGVENNMIVLNVAGKQELVELNDAREINKLVLLRRSNGKARKELFPELLLPSNEAPKPLPLQKCARAPNTWEFLTKYVEQPNRYRVRRTSSRICFDEIRDVRKSINSKVFAESRDSKSRLSF